MPWVFWAAAVCYAALQGDSALGPGLSDGREATRELAAHSDWLCPAQARQQGAKHCSVGGARFAPAVSTFGARLGGLHSFPAAPRGGTTDTFFRLPYFLPLCFRKQPSSGCSLQTLQATVSPVSSKHLDLFDAYIAVLISLLAAQNLFSLKRFPFERQCACSDATTPSILYDDLERIV